MDALIQYTVSQYGFESSHLSPHQPGVNRIDDRLNVQLFFSDNKKLDQHAESAQDGVFNAGNQEPAVYPKGLETDDLYLPSHEQRTSFFLRYLTLLNFLYFVLGAMSIVLIGKAIKVIARWK